MKTKAGISSIFSTLIISYVKTDVDVIQIL